MALDAVQHTLQSELERHFHRARIASRWRGDQGCKRWEAYIADRATEVRPNRGGPLGIGRAACPRPRQRDGRV
jgi:hypothetical protein